MTESVLQDVIRRLDADAHAASVAEESYRREAVERIEALARARSFAFRRLNFVRSIVAATAEAEDEAAAMAQATSAFLRELGWTGASETQREAIARFLPVAEAIWKADQVSPESQASDASQQASQASQASQVVDPDHGRADADAVARELRLFEQWFDGNRKAAFWSLMDGEVLELPLVEV